MLPRSWRLATLASLLLTVACTGFVDGVNVGQPSAGPNGGGSSNTAGTGGTGELSCTEGTATPLHARLLTPSQYDNSVQDWFGVVDHPARDFDGGVATRLDAVAVERRANAAAAVAAQARAALATWSPCAAGTPGTDATCKTALVDKLGRLAFRRPLDDTERTQLLALLEAGIAEKDLETGVEWLVTGLLQSPDFSYQLTLLSAGETPGVVVPLEPYALAARLALFVWDSSPDAALFDAAAAGTLNNQDGVKSQLSRLLQDTRFERGIASFYRNWLRLEGFKEVARDDPGLTGDVLASLQASMLKSATAPYSSPTPSLTALLSGESYFFDAKLRAFYGLSGGTDALEPTTLPNEGRHGLLTHPALMTLFARPHASNPIARGLWLERTLLCNEIPPPPAGIAIPPLASDANGLSTRQKLEDHTTQPLCQGCHAHIDPAGFSLESYDAVGRFRTQDAGAPVDTSGTMSDNKDTDGPFANGSELFDRLAKSTDVRRCFARHYLNFALARDLADPDACSLNHIAKDFVATDDLKALVVSVASSDAFRLRQTEAPGAAP